MWAQWEDKELLDSALQEKGHGGQAGALWRGVSQHFLLPHAGQPTAPSSAVMQRLWAGSAEDLGQGSAWKGPTEGQGEDEPQC